MIDPLKRNTILKHKFTRATRSDLLTWCCRIQETPLLLIHCQVPSHIKPHAELFVNIMLPSKKRFTTPSPPSRPAQPFSYPTPCTGSNQSTVETSFWDAFPQPRLTSRALKECEKRNNNNRQTAERSSNNTNQATPSDSTFVAIKRFARQGGPSLSDVIGWPEGNHSLASSMDTESKIPSQKKSSKISVYDWHFEQILIDNGIYGAEYDDDDEKYTRPQASIHQELIDILEEKGPNHIAFQIDEKEYKDFKAKSANPSNESTWVKNVFSIIEGKEVQPLHLVDHAFNNLEPFFDVHVPDAKPDVYDGLKQDGVHKRVRTDLETLIIPTKVPRGPMLPNFFVEAKGGLGKTAVVLRQACYDGAIGARTVHQLWSFNKHPDTTYDNNAYTISVTLTAEKVMKIYAHHPTMTNDPKLPTVYHMDLLDSFLLDSFERYCTSVTAFRNIRRWAELKRYELARDVNAVAEALEQEEADGEPADDPPRRGRGRPKGPKNHASHNPRQSSPTTIPTPTSSIHSEPPEPGRRHSERITGEPARKKRREY